MQDVTKLKIKASLVRKWCLISTTEAASGHPTSCLSAADLTTALFDKFFTYDLKNPLNPNNDRLIFSKGHAAPLLYALFALSGGLPIEELKTLRQFSSRLEGHPTPYFPYTEAATGSLGQGLSIGAGIAFALRAQVQSSPKVYVLMGDGEVEEGNAWEAVNFASHNRLDNLIVILDVNGLELRGKTMYGYDIKKYKKIFLTLGFEVFSIDGHNFSEINNAFVKARRNKTGKPVVIIAKTIKGKGVSFLEGREDFHGKTLNKDDLIKALNELFLTGKKIKEDSVIFNLKKPLKKNSQKLQGKQFLEEDSPRSSRDEVDGEAGKKTYKIGEEASTREAFGDKLCEIGKVNPYIYVLDADVYNSTFTDRFGKKVPERFVQCFIAEQNMIGVACGLSAMGKIPFVSTFASFLTRGFDQIRMSAISKSNIKFNGSHAGVSIGEDGPSQMGLEDLAMFGAIPDSIIFHPSDAVSTAKILPLLEKHKGISYLRTLRPKTQVLYSEDEEFKVGGSKILRSSKNDLLTIAAMGITVFEALTAYEILKKEGIMVRVLDCYCLKPIDKETLLRCVGETKEKVVITVEDHYLHGGLGDFVLSALSSSKTVVEKMGVSAIPRSGKKEDLLNYVGISSNHIVDKVKKIAKGQSFSDRLTSVLIKEETTQIA